jgi:hypothetical protein
MCFLKDACDLFFYEFVSGFLVAFFLRMKEALNNSDLEETTLFSRSDDDLGILL